MIALITTSTFGSGPDSQTPATSRLVIGVDSLGAHRSSLIAAVTQSQTTTAPAERA